LNEISMSANIHHCVIQCMESFSNIVRAAAGGVSISECFSGYGIVGIGRDCAPEEENGCTCS
jgi:hypothetical protein